MAHVGDFSEIHFFCAIGKMLSPLFKSVGSVVFVAANALAVPIIPIKLSAAKLIEIVFTFIKCGSFLEMNFVDNPNVQNVA